MPKKLTPTPIHPLAMAEALQAINEAAGAYVMTVQTVADLAEAITPAEAQRRLILASDAFRAVMWPEED